MTVGLLLTAIVVTAQVVIGATAAEARCVGVNQATTSTLGASYVLAEERPATGTCNDNRSYSGLLRRASTYAQYVSVYTQDGGVWTLRQKTNSTAYVGYSYGDTNSYSLMTLCWYEYDTPAGTPHCGWGSNAAPAGVTPGNNPSLFTNTSSLHGVNSGF